MCGMTRTEDIQKAIELGVDALGLIFYEKSTRCVSLEQAKILLNNIPPFVDLVGVCVNSEADFIKRLIDELPLHLLQFHGDEDAEFCEQFKKPYIKAIHPKNEEHILGSMQEFQHAQALLLDTPSVMRGGSGHCFNWEIIPEASPKPFILAGGLNEFNLGEAIKTCSPWAVDVCSGIESLPGIKDHIKMSRFMKTLGDVNHE
ncbi:phosphoribosylanthranilate isomerase [Legionella sp. km772]|nr:phosphoribosylanthranilate isomerase [Legionella sp. km772]